jgi:hypothetical protein
LDYWETWGFGRDIQTYYEPIPLELPTSGSVLFGQQMMILRDRDTDDDGLPDIWEHHVYQQSLFGVTSMESDFLHLIGGESSGPNGLTMKARWQYGLDGTTTVAFIDQNGNGIPDEWELFYFGRLLQPGEHLTDYDGDGMSIYHEFLAGTDPTNPGESLRVSSTSIMSASPVLTWSGTQNYRVMYTGSLLTPWVMDTNIANYSRVSIGGGAYAWTYTDPNPQASGARFYRVVIVPGSAGFP